jgi:uncharacterized protein YwgA
MQKAVFLAELRGSENWRHLYEFIPYNWGPFSRDLQDDLGELLCDGRLDRREFQSGKYHSYVTTPSGFDEIRDVLESLQPPELTFLIAIRQFVVTRTFNQLLRDVYRAYPAYAVNSQLR